MSRFVMFFVGLSLFVVPDHVAQALAQEPGIGATPVQLVAARPRRSTVRRYRSYSIEPSTPATIDGATIGGGVTQPSVVPAPSYGTRSYSTPRSSGGSRPSYMRADSKARGRFGQ